MIHITYQKLQNQDLVLLAQLVSLYEEAFEMEDFELPDEDYLLSLLENEGMIFYVATLNGQVLGGLTAHILPSVYEPTSEVYVYDLAVKANYQRQGIAKQLLAELAKECLKLGFKEIFVQADIEDQHAIDFYKATGGSAAEVIHFSYSL